MTCQKQINLQEQILFLLPFFERNTYLSHQACPKQPQRMSIQNIQEIKGADTKFSQNETVNDGLRDYAVMQHYIRKAFLVQDRQEAR